MTAQQINKAKQAIEQIFQNLNIKQFIYVDDVFAFKDLHDVEKVIGLFAEAVKLRSVEAQYCPDNCEHLKRCERR